MVLVYDTTLRERIASISFEEERCVDREYWVVGGGGRGGGEEGGGKCVMREHEVLNEK